MLVRASYSIEKKYVSDQYIDFELSFVDLSKASFSFLYRKSGASSWEQNAIIEISQSGFVRGNKVDRVVLESGVCNLRWYYSVNDIEYRDSVDIKIDPSFHSSMFVFLDDKTSMVEFGLSGTGEVSVLPGKRFGEDFYVSGGDLYYNDAIICSGITGAYITSFTVNLTKRFLLADSLNNRLVEVDEYGSVISEYLGYSPSYCEYNSTTGNVLLVDSSVVDVKEIYWKDENGDPSPNIGTEIWSYNVDFPTDPLVDPKSATYGVSDNVIIADASIIKVDRTGPTRTELSYFQFKTKLGTNQYFPSSLAFSFEINEDELFSSEGIGSILNYSSDPDANITYNRSLRDDSAIISPRVFDNALFYPVKPIIPSTDGANVTLKMLNSDVLSRKTKDGYIYDGRRVPVLEDLEPECSRGNILFDNPFWGVSEAYNRGIGSQSLVCMTGQTLKVDITYPGTKVGFIKLSENIDPVYVRETISVDFVDVTSDHSTSYLSDFLFVESTTFSIDIPDATSESYLASISRGFHGEYLLKITVKESYYNSNEFEEKIAIDNTFYFYIPIFSFWWRQVFKEIVIPQSPIISDFDLFDYTQTASSFFDSYTCYPSFYKTVGMTTLAISQEQKDKIIFENAFALVSYYSGICPGDSPLSNVFGLGAESYVPGKNDVSTNLHRIDIESRTIDNKLPGLNAEYQAINLFNYYPGVVCSNSQFVRDLFPVMFSDGNVLKADWIDGGMMTVPMSGQLITEDVYTLDGSEQISFSIDAPDISIDSIYLKGKYQNSDKIVPGDEKITLYFTSSSADIQEVTMGVSVDNGPFSSYSDPSGELRQFVFATPGVITDKSVVNGFVELTDSNQNKYVYNVTKKASPAIISSSINNVTVSIDRPGKLLSIKYDLNSRYGFVPYNISLYLKIEGEYLDASDSVSGDISRVFSGLSKLMTINYSEFIADEDLQRGNVMIKIVLSSLISSEPMVQYEYSLFLRTPDIWDDRITEEVAAFISEESEDRPAKVISEDKIYSIGTWDVSDFSFSNPRIATIFSSSSSLCSSGSSSSSNSSSSISLSSSSYSSQSSSSSSSAS